MNHERLIKVIVAEDEPIILNNTIKKVEKASPDYKVIGKAQSGQKALALIKEEQPDILITDISMPGMNGLSLIENIYKKYPSIHIIILSGYSNFEYAQKAIVYGVREYILKPISQDSLSKVLNSMSDEIIKQRKKEQRNILMMTLKGDNLSPNSPYHFEDHNYYLCLITIGNLPSRHITPNIESNFEDIWDTLDFSICLTKLDIIKNIWLIDENYKLQKFLILCPDKKITNPAMILNSLCQYIDENVGSTPFHICMHKNPIGYQAFWSMAKKMRAFCSRNLAMFSKDSILLKNADEVSPKPRTLFSVKDSLYKISSNTQLIKYLCQTMESFQKDKMSQYVIDNFIYDVFQELPAIFSVDSNSCYAALTNILSLMPTYESLEVLLDFIKNTVKNLTEHTDEGSLNPLHQRVHKYITKNYKQKITMNDLAERYGYTASYIHRIYKKEFCISPLQYLVSLRIEEAKKMMLNAPHMDIQSIASEVGYDDSRYFSRVFKNECGITPSAWIMGHEKDFHIPS